jgi:hypothetical protein
MSPAMATRSTIASYHFDTGLQVPHRSLVVLENTPYY